MTEPGPMVPVPHRVVERIQETADTWTLHLEPASGAAPAFSPGQFNMVYAFGNGEVPISISGSPDAPTPLIHTVRDVGPVTRAICAARPGDTLGVRGPFGSAWPLEEAEGLDLVVVAGGLGLAPLRSTVLAAIEHPERFASARLLYGGREPQQLLYREEIGRWTVAGLPTALIVDGAAADSPWAGEVGVVTRLIERADFDAENTVAMLCGPEAMMRFSARALRVRGVPYERIHVSMERNMKCAVTHCGRCQLGPKFVCREGPVFRLADVQPLLDVREL